MSVLQFKRTFPSSLPSLVSHFLMVNLGTFILGVLDEILAKNKSTSTWIEIFTFLFATVLMTKFLQCSSIYKLECFLLLL